jgi:hypothetical protein
MVVAVIFFAIGLVASILAKGGGGGGSGGGGNPPPPAGPPAPTLVLPAAGASVGQPVILSWNASAATVGPIGSYTWQVGTTAAFTTVIGSGFTDIDSDPTVSTPTTDKISGLPNGIYFWRVKATALTSNGGVDSAWSATRTFTITSLGAAPAMPTISTPVNNAQFHLAEFFKINWFPVAGAQYYILEADDEPTFSHPLTLSESPITFGTQFGAGWGNALNVYYRVRAVSADGVRSLPSATLAVRITDAAPVPPAVSPVSPATGATVATPFFIDWSGTPNPQVPGYAVEFNTSATFANATSALLLPGASRSDYLITADLLAPGNYFWRVRALHGNVAGPWSTSRTLTVTAGIRPPNVGLFAILPDAINAYGGNTISARVILDNPAPSGGAVISLSTDIPQVQLPFPTVTVPVGKTDAAIPQIVTGPVPNNGLSIGLIGDLFAGYSAGQVQNSLGVLPIYWGLNLNNQSVVGGSTVNGVVTLLSPAPAGGTTISLVSSDSSVVRPPASVFIPQGATEAQVSIATSPVAAAVRIIIDSGTAVDGYRAPQNTLVVTPAGVPPATATLSTLTLNSTSVPAGSVLSGVVTLTAPAPTGGRTINLGASANGTQIAPASVTIPAGGLSATFSTIPAPQINSTTWVLFQARDNASGNSLGRLFGIQPAPGPATLLAIGPSGQNVIGGNPGRASVALIMPAPAGGGTVTLSTDNPTYIHVPPSVTIPAGNSAVSFAIATSPVAILPTGGSIFASAGGITKSIFIDVSPDPNAPPLLQGVTFSPASVVGGNTTTGTLRLNSPAPAGGVQATLSTSNLVASPPPIVTVPAGLTSVTFTVNTSAVSANTSVTITAFVGSTSKSGGLTVTRAGSTPPPTNPGSPLSAPSLLAPAANTRVAPGATLAFDWSDVSGAANYTFQVSDQSSFSSSLITSQTLTASQFSTSTLPTKTLWWRARANDASGNTGTWSTSRRFEIKK